MHCIKLLGDKLAELICLSTNPYLPLKQFIGSQVAVDQVTDSGQLIRSTGIITEASLGQSDGALTLYRLRMQDATALWHKRRNSRVFMNKTVVEIVETIFKEWQSKSPLFAASLALDLSGLKNTYDTRPFSMQANESDSAYVKRLLASENITYLVDEANYIVASQHQSIEAQKLRLIDDNAQFQALSRRSIRYHRSNATEQTDSITSLIAQRQLQPTAIHIQRWQADAEPYSARYISKDPIGLYGGINTIIYVHNPLQWVDRMGLNWGGLDSYASSQISEHIWKMNNDSNYYNQVMTEPQSPSVAPYTTMTNVGVAISLFAGGSIGIGGGHTRDEKGKKCGTVANRK